MADSSVSVTPGVGASVDARTQPGGDLRQVVTIGDGDTAPIAPVDAIGLHVHPGLSGTAALTNVTSSATSVQLLASNTARRGLVIYNDSTSILYVKFGTTASATSYTFEVPNEDYLILPGGMGVVYTGRIDGIWAAANGAARITELT